MNLNKVSVAGTLTRDPEMRYTPKGTAIAKLGIAINRTYTVEGEKKEEVVFVDIDAFGKQAELLSQYFKKGNRIYLDGRLKMDNWDDKQTHQKRSKLGVVLESFQFVDRKGDTTAAPAPAPAPVSNPAATADDAPPF